MFSIKNLEKKYEKNKSVIIFIVGLLSYLYILNNIFNNNYFIVAFYFTTLVIGFLFIKNTIFLFNSLIILYDIFIHKHFKEGNTEKNQIEKEISKQEKKADNKDDKPDIDGIENLEDEDEQEKLLNSAETSESSEEPESSNEKLDGTPFKKIPKPVKIDLSKAHF